MANLRANKIVGIGSTDAGVVFGGPIKINSQGVMYFPKGDTTQRGRGRGIFGGGIESPNPSTTAMQYIQIQSQGNAVEFGDMDLSGYGSSGGNMTRALYFRNREIQYVEIQSQGNAIDFGDIGYNTSISALGLQDSHGGLGGF